MELHSRDRAQLDGSTLMFYAVVEVNLHVRCTQAGDMFFCASDVAGGDTRCDSFYVEWSGREAIQLGRARLSIPFHGPICHVDLLFVVASHLLTVQNRTPSRRLRSRVFESSHVVQDWGPFVGAGSRERDRPRSMGESTLLRDTAVVLLCPVPRIHMLTSREKGLLFDNSQHSTRTTGNVSINVQAADSRWHLYDTHGPDARTTGREELTRPYQQKQSNARKVCVATQKRYLHRQ